MSYKFKKIQSVETTDTYYDLFLGGYIKPKKMLSDPKQVAEVEAAIKVIKDFIQEAEDAEVLIQY